MISEKSYREKVKEGQVVKTCLLYILSANLFDDVEGAFAEVCNFTPLFGGNDIFGEEGYYPLPTQGNAGFETILRGFRGSVLHHRLP